MCARRDGLVESVGQHLNLDLNFALELRLSASEVSGGANTVGLWSLGNFRSLRWSVADIVLSVIQRLMTIGEVACLGMCRIVP